MIKGRIFDTLSGGPMRSSWLKSIWGFFGLSGLVVDFESGFNEGNYFLLWKLDKTKKKIFNTTAYQLIDFDLDVLMR